MCTKLTQQEHEQACTNLECKRLSFVLKQFSFRLQRYESPKVYSIDVTNDDNNH
jgi:hypothetical protein